MIPIQIDISEILMTYQSVAESKNEFAAFLVDKMVDTVQFEWENQIKGSLHSTREEYRKAIYVERPDDHNAIIGLSATESQLALMIEEGCSPFDIKSGMEKSDKKHTKADGGWYITIPFRFATSEALAESAVFSNRMPLSVQNAVLNQPTNPITNRTVPLTDAIVPTPYDAIKSNKTTGYVHKSSIYEGLHRRDVSSTKKENRGGYMSFRRISDKSDPDSWIHSGFEAKKLMDRAVKESNLDSVISQAIDEFLGI